MNLVKIFSDSFQDNWYEPALTHYETGLEITYGGLACRMSRIHLLLERLEAGIGTHIAIIGENSIDWITNYMSAITFGAIAVTLPNVYNTAEMLEMLQQANTEILFIDPDMIGPETDFSLAPDLKLVISNDSSSVIFSRLLPKSQVAGLLDRLDMIFQASYPSGFLPGMAIGPFLKPDSPVSIFFTSGTIGRPRPVLLSADNIEGNVIYGIKAGIAPLHANLVTSTKMGTVWGTIFNVLVPLASGAHLVVFTNVRDIVKLQEVFKKVKPVKMMLSSILASRIYNHVIEQHKQLPLTRFLNKLPGGELIANRFLRKLMKQALGSNCREVLIGYMMMNNTLIYNIRRSGIPATVVYGLTECGGLVGYAPADEYIPGTSGRVIQNLIKCRLRPYTLPGFPDDMGFLEVKGMTVMKRYYDDDGRSKTNFTGDGWFITGDLATVDSKGNITIIGRLDSLIKLSRGTVAPEKIQVILSEHPVINQVIVVGQDDRLAALIYPNLDEVSRRQQKLHASVEHIVSNAVAEVNQLLPLVEHIDDVIVSEEPLQQTAKGTIAREFYVN